MAGGDERQIKVFEHTSSRTSESLLIVNISPNFLTGNHLWTKPSCVKQLFEIGRMHRAKLPNPSAKHGGGVLVQRGTEA